MKILVINTDYRIGGSVGRIAYEIALQYAKEGNEVAFAYGRECYTEDEGIQLYKIGTKTEIYLHALYTRLTDKCGFGSAYGTREFIKWADQYNPDMVWLHNVHGYYINIVILFNWIKSRPQMKVKWTLHDCWAFTGHCTYFSFVSCNQWKSCCRKCVQKNRYPAALFSNCKRNYINKKELFTNIPDLEIIVPSNWLKDLVRQSFLGGYKITIQNNSVDKTVFRYVESSVKEKLGIKDKKVILGVANVWEERKGLKDFFELAKLLNDEYVIVLVGLSEKQMKIIPKGVLGIEKTDNVNELVELYSCADYFVNPSREETFGMTTLEALSCKTKTIVYEDTACEEVATEYGGIVVPQDVKEIYKSIINNKTHDS